MAASLDVRLVRSNVTQKLTEAQRLHVPAATARGINRTAQKGSTQIRRGVAKRLRLPQKLIAERFRVDGTSKGKRFTFTRATVRNLIARLVYYTRGLPVIQAKAKEQRKPGGGVKAAGGRFYADAFIANTPRGFPFVFRRAARGAGRVARLPVVGLKIPVSGAVRKLTRVFINQSAVKIFIQEFDRDLKFRFRKAGL